MKHAREKLYSAPDLKARGWTDSLISKHLPKCDDTRKNPNYLSGPPMRLWLKSRVEALEAREDVRTDLQRVNDRREVAAEKRRQKKIADSQARRAAESDADREAREARYAAARRSMERRRQQAALLAD